MPGLTSGGAIDNEYTRGRTNLGLISIGKLVAVGGWMSRSVNVVAIPEPNPFKPRLFERSATNHVGTGNILTGAFKWIYTTGGTVFASGAVGDVDADGVKELLIPSKDDYLYCMKPDGTRKWRKNIIMSWEGYCAPTIYDIDFDGKMEILIAEGTAAFEQRLYCLNPDSSVRWRYDLPDGRAIENSAPSVYDIDGDGELEILFGTSDVFDYTQSRVYCLRPNGILKWQYVAGNYTDSPPAIADIDGDGEIEIVVVPWNKVVCLRSDGTEKWSTTVGDANSQVTIADVDGDGQMEVFIDDRDGFTLHCLNSDGTVRWSYGTGSQVITRGVVLCDIDNDGDMEVVFQSADGYTYCLRARDKTFKWKYYPSGGTGRGCIACDVDNDGYMEVMVGCTDRLICLSHTGTHQWRRFYRVEGVVCIEDQDGDDKVEIFYGSESNIRCIWSD